MTDGLEKTASRLLLFSLLHGSPLRTSGCFGVFIIVGPYIFISLNGFPIAFFGSISFDASSPNTH